MIISNIILVLSIILLIINSLSLYFTKKAFEENHKKQNELYDKIEKLEKENKELKKNKK